MIKKLIQHTIIYGLSPYIPKILGFFILPIITKDLTDIDYGIYGIILAYVGAIEVLKDLGLNLILYNSYTRMPFQFKWLWRQIYGFLSIWNIAYAVFAGALIYFIVPSPASENVWAIIILNVLPIIVFGPTSLVGRVFYQMREKPMQIGVRTIVFGILSVLINLFTISYLKMGYMGWFWSTCITGLLMNASFWYPINRIHKLTPIFNYRWKTIRENLTISLPTVPHYYSTYLLQTSDRAIMNLMEVNTQDIGKYSFAGTFGGYFRMLGNAVGQAIRPVLNTGYREKKFREVRNLIFIIQGMFFLATFLTSIWTKDIFLIMVKNAELSKTYPLAVILIMATNYRPMYLGSAGPLMYFEHTKKLLRVTFAAAILSVILNFIFIPVFGYVTPVFNMFFSLMYMGYSGFFIKEFKQKNTAKFYPLIWLLATVLLTIAAFFMVEFSFEFKLALSVILLSFAGIMYFYKGKIKSKIYG